MGSNKEAEGFGRFLGRMWSKRWIRWVMYLWVAAFIAGKLLLSTQITPPAQGQAASGQPPLAAAAASSQRPAEPTFKCAVGEPSGRTVRLIASPIPLVNQPSSKADRLLNEAATKYLGSPQYFSIERSDLLVEDCTSSGWSHVRLSKPDQRGNLVGWVDSSKLRERQMVSGVEVFTQENIEWSKGTKPHQELIVAGVNKIHRTNPRCKQLELGSVELSGSKSTKANPVFYVTCRHEGTPWNAFFSKSDVEKDVALDGTHVDHAFAATACKGAARARATNPSTVDFSEVVSLSIIDFPNGRTKVQSKFTAQNAFGAKGTYRIECMFERGALIDVNVSED